MQSGPDVARGNKDGRVGGGIMRLKADGHVGRFLDSSRFQPCSRWHHRARERLKLIQDMNQKFNANAQFHSNLETGSRST